MEKERAGKAIWLRFRGRAGEMMGEITVAQNYNQGRPPVFSFSAFIRCRWGEGVAVGRSVCPRLHQGIEENATTS